MVAGNSGAAQQMLIHHHKYTSDGQDERVRTFSAKCDMQMELFQREILMVGSKIL